MLEVVLGVVLEVVVEVTAEGGASVKWNSLSSASGPPGRLTQKLEDPEEEEVFDFKRSPSRMTVAPSECLINGDSVDLLSLTVESTDTSNISRDQYCDERSESQKRRCL